MSYKKDFNVFVGGTSGVFKGVKVGKKACISKNIQSLVSIKADDIVTTMSWGYNEDDDDDEKELLIACGEKGVRSVKVYDTECSMFTCSFFCDIGEGRINGISRYEEAILTAVESGHIKLWKFDEKEQFVIDAGKNLERMRHSRVDRNIVATGGREHRLQLFDLSRQTKVFVEKNLPHDSLELRVPIWISDMDFLPGTQCIAAVGRHGHVRLYDPKAQKRPVVKFEATDYPFTVMSVVPREKQIIAGTGKGQMNLIDFRKPGKVLNSYKGFVGAVTGIACSKSKPYVVSVGLDRYLRVHHIDTKELLESVYLTSKLTCLALRSEFSLDSEDEEKEENARNSRELDNEVKDVNGVKSAKNKGARDNSESDSEYEAMFDEMQVVTADKDNAQNSLTDAETQKHSKRKSTSNTELSRDVDLSSTKTKRLKKIRA